MPSRARKRRRREAAMSPPLPFDPVEEARRQWAAHWGAGPAPSMRAVTSIMRAQQILMARLNELLKPFGLTFPRYEALLLLYFSRTGALPLGKLGERLQVHPTSVTNTIDGLEKLGFVERVPSEVDRRQTLARLTVNGRQTAEKATAVLNEERFGTGPLGKAELDEVSALLRPLRADADGFPAG
jgi:DNA-binding MarR family transcriptional regulator